MPIKETDTFLASDGTTKYALGDTLQFPLKLPKNIYDAAIQAFNESIKKWHDIAKGTETDQAWRNCRLCLTYVRQLYNAPTGEINLRYDDDAPHYLDDANSCSKCPLAGYQHFKKHAPEDRCSCDILSAYKETKQRIGYKKKIPIDLLMRTDTPEAIKESVRAAIKAAGGMVEELEQARRWFMENHEILEEPKPKEPEPKEPEAEKAGEQKEQEPEWVPFTKRFKGQNFHTGSIVFLQHPNFANGKLSLVMISDSLLDNSFYFIDLMGVSKDLATGREMAADICLDENEVLVEKDGVNAIDDDRLKIYPVLTVRKMLEDGVLRVDQNTYHRLRCKPDGRFDFVWHKAKTI
jgi:hypothetical protein